MMEIFDVTETDPSLLVLTDQDVHYPMSSTSSSRSRHFSAPSLTHHRRNSSTLQAISHNLVPSRIHDIETRISNKFKGDNNVIPQSDNYFQILGFNGDTDHDGFSDPESEQIKRWNIFEK